MASSIEEIINSVIKELIVATIRVERWTLLTLPFSSFTFYVMHYQTGIY